MGCGCLKNSQLTLTETSKQDLALGQEIAPPSGLTPVPQSQETNQSAQYNILNVIQDKMNNSLTYVEAETMRFRLAECQACTSFKAGLCLKCGCIVEFKVRYAKSTCPQNKW